MFNASIESLELTHVAIGVGIVAIVIILFLFYCKWDSHRATTIHEKRNKLVKKQ